MIHSVLWKSAILYTGVLIYTHACLKKVFLAQKKQNMIEHLLYLQIQSLIMKFVVKVFM